VVAPVKGALDPREAGTARLRIVNLLPRLSILSALAVAVTLAVTVLWPVLTHAGRQAASPGAVTSHHILVGARCQSCHAEPFRGVADAKCASCHEVGDHADAMTRLVTAHPEQRTPCAGCHKEHHGPPRLIPQELALCTGCHASIERVVADTREPEIQSFATHPEFAALAQTGRDATAFKFSHAEHLQAHPGTAHPEALSCPSCHEAIADGTVMQPIAYDKHCQRCHELTLDGRLAGVRVPHGSPDRALEVIRAELVRSYVDPAMFPAAASPDGGGDGAAPEMPSPERVAAESLDLEQGLYAGGKGCQRCHDVLAAAARAGRSLFAVVPPRIPQQWMPASTFSHGAHRTTPCEDCHVAAERSTTASDVLVPGIARCRECHADPGVSGKVESPCLGCHRYHRTKPTKI
jgi:hypothetical protein